MTERMDAAAPRLAPIENDRIDAIESGLFAGIAQARAAQRRRRRIWTGAGAVAAAVVVAIAIAPVALPFIGGTSGSAGSAAVAPSRDLQGAPAQPDTGFQAQDSAAVPAAGAADSAKTQSESPSATRDIVTTASATVRVDDVRAAAQQIAAAAKSHGGYTETMVIGQAGGTATPDTGKDGLTSPAPLPPVSGASITVRVPADQLDDVIASLAGLGTVESSTINRQDVTTQAIDLQARVKASQASVARLTELMRKAGSVSSLLQAENALSERQAMLESQQQELKALKDQVAMSTLSVTLLPQAAAAKANPAGFASGLIAGWNTLVASVNGIVVAIGFLLPWLVVAAIVAGIVWAVLAIARRRRRARRTAATPMPPAA